MSHQPLSDQHAIVTGAGRGIGAAIAAELARLGATLTLMGRSGESLQAQSRQLQEGHGRPVKSALVDVTKPESVERAFETAKQALGAPAILVNNAGAAESAPFLETGFDLWSRLIAVNLTGAYLCARAVLAHMVAARYGRIVNVASTAALRGYPYVAAYCASKHGLLGLTRALALEVARTGVTVNAVCPGFTDTDLAARAAETIAARTGRSPEQARAELERYNPQGRLVQPAEVAQAVGWLCLPGSGSITGQAIVVAGGEVM